jgi:hypothetical protein
VAGLFPPQDRDWSLPAEVPLTPQAACRLGREAATQQSFEPAARALSCDWTLDGPLHSEEVRRWGEALGKSAVAQRDAEVREYQLGQRPACPPNAVPLLVLGMDGGRYQSMEKDPETDSRWREEKVFTVSSYLPGDGKEPEEGGRRPQKRQGFKFLSRIIESTERIATAHAAILARSRVREHGQTQGNVHFRGPARETAAIFQDWRPSLILQDEAGSLLVFLSGRCLLFVLWVLRFIRRRRRLLRPRHRGNLLVMT